jgi:hypothetical protein
MAIENWELIDLWRQGWSEETLIWLSASRNKQEADTAKQHLERLVQAHISNVVITPAIINLFENRLTGIPFQQSDQEQYYRVLWQQIYAKVPPSLPRHVHEDIVLNYVRKIFSDQLQHLDSVALNEQSVN